jgi:methylmalonyl-CoA mutase cobalamin-binding subunit
VSKTFGEWYQKANKTEDRNTAAIQERVTAVMLSIPKEVFADSFQELYERCQPCVLKDDGYFECQ